MKTVYELCLTRYIEPENGEQMPTDGMSKPATYGCAFEVDCNPHKIITDQSRQQITTMCNEIILFLENIQGRYDEKQLGMEIRCIKAPISLFGEIAERGIYKDLKSGRVVEANTTEEARKKLISNM